ncbi:MAG TPA: transposase [Planctomycetota bacterium]|nr:transposase [Planctomycetota bacterium]
MDDVAHDGMCVRAGAGTKSFRRKAQRLDPRARFLAQECSERTTTDAGKAIYKLRASTIECVNALPRNRGLQHFRVRGTAKVCATVLLFALAHGLMREESLKRERAERAGMHGNTS